MADPQRYSTRMHLIGRNTGVPVPEEVLEALGGGRRPAVDVAVNGYRYRSTVGIMDRMITVGLSKAVESDMRIAHRVNRGLLALEQAREGQRLLEHKLAPAIERSQMG